jgi:glycosyltransferase involved in cell wall biosynthesis
VNRKNILYCEGNTDGTIGGSYYSLFFLVDGLDKTLYKPIVIFYTHNNLIPVFEKAGIEVRVFNLPKPLVIIKKTRSGVNILLMPLALIQKAINYYRFFIWQSIKYTFFLKRHNIELIHLNNTILRGHNWIQAAKIVGAKCVSHERGINTRIPKIARYFGNKLDAIICISGAVNENLKAQGFSSEKLFIIHNGLDPERVKVENDSSSIKEYLGIEDGAPIIGIVGNIREWKGQQVVVEAIALVRKYYPTIKCLLVGDSSDRDKTYRERIDRLIVDNDLTENIIFTGYQSNVADYVNITDVVIHASILPEPFGRVLIEAMALSKPLIGSRGGAVPEIIEDGITGLMFEPGNVEELALKIQELLDNRGKAIQMGRAGLQRLNEKFHIKTNVAKTEALYRKLLF